MLTFESPLCSPVSKLRTCEPTVFKSTCEVRLLAECPSSLCTVEPPVLHIPGFANNARTQPQIGNPYKRHFHTLHYITLHYITLHYITLHYITLHYITFITYPLCLKAKTISDRFATSACRAASIAVLGLGFGIWDACAHHARLICRYMMR